MCRLFDLIDHRDSEIFHRNVTLTLSITEQLIAAEPKVSRAFTGSEVCGRRKEGPVEIRLRPESFEKTRASVRQSSLCTILPTLAPPKAAITKIMSSMDTVCRFEPRGMEAQHPRRSRSAPTVLTPTRARRSKDQSGEFE